jgi:hypothetical protein
MECDECGITAEKQAKLFEVKFCVTHHVVALETVDITIIFSIGNFHVHKISYGENVVFGIGSGAIGFCRAQIFVDIEFRATNSDVFTGHTIQKFEILGPGCWSLPES